MGIELMKLKLDKALSLVALGVLGVLNSAHAAPVYEIVNIDSYDGLQGTLEGTRNGYALGVNANDQLVGISKGKKNSAVQMLKAASLMLLMVSRRKKPLRIR